jgi:YHS domain-containing protein
MAQCPVCGSDIEQGNPTETDYREEAFGGTQVEHEGETYVFCCEEHRDAFEENPDEYV